MTILLVVGIVDITESNAQSSLHALRFSSQVPGQDAQSIGLASSSIAQYQGFGSHLHNPATPALSGRSAISFGVGNRNIEQRSRYLEQSTSFKDNQYSLTHAGYDHSGTSSIGTIAIGGGYIQTADYNQAFSLHAFNDLTSRTHQFLSDYTADAAFEAYALGYNSDDELQSIFDFGQFDGVSQFSEITHRGHSGEYSIYLATEFVQDFYVGISGSIPVSRYSFANTFIEDASGSYTGEEGTGNYNIDQVRIEEQSSVRASGMNARLGMVFTGLHMLDVGASYTTTTRWSVEESFRSLVQTRFDGPVTLDGQQLENRSLFEGDLEGKLSYTSISPARYEVGFATKNLIGLPWLSVSFSAEYVDYSRIRLSNFDTPDLEDRPNLENGNILRDLDFRQIQTQENSFVTDEFLSVWNLKGGLSITHFENIQPRLGFARLDNNLRSQQENVRQFLSAGLGIGMHELLTLDIGLQYGFWKETSRLYTVDADTERVIVDGEAVSFTETAEQDVHRLHATIGLSVQF